jgi:hypothetical protein
MSTTWTLSSACDGDARVRHIETSDGEYVLSIGEQRQASSEDRTGGSVTMTLTQRGGKLVRHKVVHLDIQDSCDSGMQ